MWERRYSKSKKKYYLFNSDTGESKWETSTISELPKGWIECTSSRSGKKYWYHEASQKSVWERPTYTNIDIISLNYGSDIGKRSRIDEEVNSNITTTTTTIINEENESKKKKTSNNSIVKVAVIVPFRDLHAEQKRSAHLLQFIPYMMKFLNPKTNYQHEYKIYIIEQSVDNRKFNRGKLLNIGYDIAQKEGFNLFIFHDVDLLPSDDLLEYYTALPHTGPCHIARVWNRYNNNEKYFGGIVAFTKEQFSSINGFPNTFWGWGGEDDEMIKRVEAVKLTPTAPSKGSITDLEKMNLEEKLKFLKNHKEQKCMSKWEALDEHKDTWKENGLKTLSYEIQKRKAIDGEGDDGSKAEIVTVECQLNNHWSDDKSQL